MLTYCAVMLTLIFLGLAYHILVSNNGFSSTNRNIDSLSAQCKLLIVKADKVIGKYANMTSAIEEIKG